MEVVELFKGNHLPFSLVEDILWMTMFSKNKKLETGKSTWAALKPETFLSFWLKHEAFISFSQPFQLLSNRQRLFRSTCHLAFVSLLRQKQPSKIAGYRVQGLSTIIPYLLCATLFGLKNTSGIWHIKEGQVQTYMIRRASQEYLNLTLQHAIELKLHALIRSTQLFPTYFRYWCLRSNICQQYRLTWTVN